MCSCFFLRFSRVMATHVQANVLLPFHPMPFALQIPAFLSPSFLPSFPPPPTPFPLLLPISFCSHHRAPQDSSQPRSHSLAYPSAFGILDHPHLTTIAVQIQRAHTSACTVLLLIRYACLPARAASTRSMEFRRTQLETPR